MARKLRTKRKQAEIVTSIISDKAFSQIKVTEAYLRKCVEHLQAMNDQYGVQTKDIEAVALSASTIQQIDG